MPSISESVARQPDVGGMQPRGLALHHPASALLDEWAQYSCPTKIGRDWALSDMEAAIARGPHESALTPEALRHFADEVEEKIVSGQARVVKWDEIKHDLPRQLKISPIAAIPHKSKPFHSILDLSFWLRLKDGGSLLVNETSVKTAPQGAIDQIGHSLKRIIHAFAKAGDDKKISLQSGTLRMDFGGYNAGRVKN